MGLVGFLAAEPCYTDRPRSLPEAFNVYDILAEAYMAKSMKREAIVSYARSLVINPDNENAIRMLERLRHMESEAGRQ